MASKDHAEWSVSTWRAPLGVVGFVFEGRPNVFADATGVLRTGNTAVFRIGSDALGTARAIMRSCVAPALRGVGAARPAPCSWSTRRRTPPGGRCSPTPGWRWPWPAARGSAVAQLGAVARQHGVPVSLHGTGGAWIVASEHADAAVLAAAVEHSLDRKVCNTMNVCCIPRSRSAELARRRRRRPRNAPQPSAASRPSCTDVERRRRATGSARNGSGRTPPSTGWSRSTPSPRPWTLFNRYSPRFAASLISDDPAEQDRFYAAVDAPFVGNGFTRWVDGQFALDQPELGLSNWQAGRLFARGGVLSGDSVFTIRLRAEVRDHSVHR